jgi:hypothetical protein
MPRYDTPSGDPEDGSIGHSTGCNCWTCLGLPSCGYCWSSEQHEDWCLENVDTSPFADIVIQICREWYDEVIEGTDSVSLAKRLEQAGQVEWSWDHGATVLYREVWVHDKYRTQPQNDDPPGSILGYHFFHVYELDDTKASPGSRLAPVRVITGRIGNTAIYDIRHPGQIS